MNAVPSGMVIGAGVKVNTASKLLLSGIFVTVWLETIVSKLCSDISLWFHAENADHPDLCEGREGGRAHCCRGRRSLCRKGQKLEPQNDRLLLAGVHTRKIVSVSCMCWVSFAWWNAHIVGEG